MPSQRGSLISGTTDPPYSFQPVDPRSRSASGYVDDSYADPDERSFVCSKPGFVCAAAVLFTVSFIALAFFIETGMDWRTKPNVTQTETEKVAGAGFLFHPRKGSDVTLNNGEDGPEEEHHQKIPEVEDVTEQVRKPILHVKPSLRPISDLSDKKPRDTLYIYTPFDDKNHAQSHLLRFLMDAQRFSTNCFTNFTLQDVAQFFQVEQSSESEEKNIHTCKNIDAEGFVNLRDHFKNDYRKKSKYLFVIRDPRSLIHHDFNKHGSELENCKDNLSHRCLYNEEILNNARKTVEDWNTTTAQMIEVCEKLKRDTCRIILIERLIMRQTETLDDIAKFLTMDENKDVYRMLKAMVLAVDDGMFDAKTPKQRQMVDLLSFLLTDTSNTWPWGGQLPFNVYEQLPQWAPLMGRLGYGFTSDIPDMSRNPLANVPKS